MRYMLLIYGDEKKRDAMSDGEKGAMFKEYGEFTEGIRKSGAFQAGDPLQPVGAATTVRAKNGKTVATDGPFAETKEQIGGLFVTTLPDLDEAIRLAALVPAAQYGSLEIRPIVER